MEHLFKISVTDVSGSYFDTYWVVTRGNNYTRAIKAALRRARRDGARRPYISNGEHIGLLTR